MCRPDCKKRNIAMQVGYMVHTVDISISVNHAMACSNILIACMIMTLYYFVQVLQNSFAYKPPSGVILLVDICQDEETVMTEVSRLEHVLSGYPLTNCSQVRYVMVPAASNAVSTLAWL